MPLYKQTASRDYTEYAWTESSEEQTLAYVESVANKMGGNIAAAFDAMTRYDLYDIKASEKKYNASFEIYLYSYYLPFIFVNSTGTNQDKLTLTHEFGHFCRDYLSYGAQQSLDVGEYFSQAMENLSLFYGPEGEAMRPLRLQQSLNVYVEQAAYASFEHQVYNLEDPTAKQVEALFDTASFDLQLDGWHYMLITHFFTEPMYVVSYVVSNDAALQLYQMELEEYRSGRTCLLNNLTATEPQFMAFLEQAGLESPFEKGRLQDVTELLEGILLS